MRKGEKTVDCPTRDYSLVTFEINPMGEDLDFVNEVLEEVNQHGAVHNAPSGRIRNANELRNTRYLGILSEKLITDHLQSKLGRDTHVSNSAFESYDNHVDIEIQVGEKAINFEVRSSFGYTSLRNVVCRAFDAIGPYSTSYKPDESPKDFYLRGLINEAQTGLNPKRKHTFYFAGGAPYSWFKERGVPKDFDQQGAEYLTIPLVEAMDAIEIVDEIRGVINGV